MSGRARNWLRPLDDDPAALEELRQASVKECRARVEAAGIHLGLEATDRAYELVAMGLLFEERLWAGAIRKQAKARRGRGRPPKDIHIHEDRAAILLRLRREGCMQKRIKDWVAFAAELEKQLVAEKQLTREDCLFAYAGAPNTLAQSVSRGFRKMNLTAKALAK